MEPTVPKRIHVAPVGYEKERIYKPAINYEAELVVLLFPDDDDEVGQECLRVVRQNLEDHGIDVEVRSCDIFDIEESVRKIRQVTRNAKREDVVKVNVSSGTKITAMAGMIACMFSDGDAYYVLPEDYGEHGIGIGVKETFRVPSYPLSEPDYQTLEVLDFIHQNEDDGVVLKDIGDFALSQNLPAVQNSNKEPGEGDEIYHILRPKIISPMIERNLIQEVPYDGANHITVTEEGEELLELGRSLID